MSDDSRVALVDRFYRGWRDADYETLGNLLAPDGEWIMTGNSRFSGTTKGLEAVITTRRQMHELTGGTWRAFRDDSYDIVSSEYHVIVTDRYVGERNGKSLDSHEMILALIEGDGIKALLHYFFDQSAFDEFWT